MNIAALAEKIDEVRTALNGLTPEVIQSKSPAEVRALYELAHHIRAVRMERHCAADPRLHGRGRKRRRGRTALEGSLTQETGARERAPLTPRRRLMPRTLEQIRYALTDISETLACWPGETPDNPYIAKLLHKQHTLLRAYSLLYIPPSLFAFIVTVGMAGSR